MRKLHQQPQASDAPRRGATDAAAATVASGRRIDTDGASSRAAATLIGTPRAPCHAEGTDPRGHALSAQMLADTVVDAQRGSPGLTATVMLKPASAPEAAPK